MAMMMIDAVATRKGFGIIISSIHHRLGHEICNKGPMMVLLYLVVGG